MKKDLQDKIFALYPELYTEKDLPMSQTCMCWGIETGDGWAKILERLTLGIKAIDTFFGSQTKATQVKEKFGTLRFYFSCTNDAADRLIDYLVGGAEMDTGQTCDVCGEPGTINRSGWLSVRCEVCRNEAA